MTIVGLVILSLALGLAAWLAFVWSVKSGQYDDLEGPGYRVLMDDDRPDSTETTEQRTAPENGGDRPRN